MSETFLMPSGDEKLPSCLASALDQLDEVAKEAPTPESKVAPAEGEAAALARVEAAAGEALRLLQTLEAEAAASSDEPTPLLHQVETLASHEQKLNLIPSLVESLAGHQRREEELSCEVSALRNASAIGASALIELRAAVQVQLEGLLSQLRRLEQDLATTKLELAEIVIDKETSANSLKDEVDDEMSRTKNHFNQMQVFLRETLELQVADARAEAAQATEQEGSGLRHLLESHAARTEGIWQNVREQGHIAERERRGLEERLEAGKEETMSYFHKIDKVMHHETCGVLTKLNNLSKVQDASEESSRRLEEGSRRSAEELWRVNEDFAVQSRKIQELHENLEPRVFHLEEAQRHVMARAERTEGQVKNLLASRHSSPFEVKFQDSVPGSEEPSSPSRTSPFTPKAMASEDDDAWRCSSSVIEPATRALRPTTGVRHGPMRDGPARAAQSASQVLRPGQAYRAAVPQPQVQRPRSPPRAAHSPAIVPAKRQ